ncbi:formin-like protein 6 [Clupea harengus]|uniref:Formin-like protein 6 n=1 Tax=Clupea harengus TaxID=7950 RepID=A0A8M1KQB7_CLUHA|nr:formin-like protein 6 [Clupea harengus]
MPLQMGAHLQIVLAVGSAVICFFLVLGCFLCWRRRKSRLHGDKEAALSLPALTSDPAVVTPSPWPSIGVLPVRQQYEELEGDVLEFPSLFPSPSPSASATSTSSPSEDGLSALGLAPRPRSSSDLQESTSSLARASCFPLRRLSSPAAPCSPLRSPPPPPPPPSPTAAPPCPPSPDWASCPAPNGPWSAAARWPPTAPSPPARAAG